MSWKNEKHGKNGKNSKLLPNIKWKAFFKFPFLGFPLQIGSDIRGKISDLLEVIFSGVLLLSWKIHSKMLIENKNNTKYIIMRKNSNEIFAIK